MADVLNQIVKEHGYPTTRHDGTTGSTYEEYSLLVIYLRNNIHQMVYVRVEIYHWHILIYTLLKPSASAGYGTDEIDKIQLIASDPKLIEHILEYLNQQKSRYKISR